MKGIKEIAQSIMNELDEQMREALLELGWMPPGVMECQNCYFWLKMYYDFERGRCEGPEMSKDRGIHPPDGHDVHCGPRFGCIHFKKKVD